MLRAVIFDFDGVITDSEILHFRAFNQALAEYKIQITKKDYYTDYLGLSDFDCFKAIRDKGLIKLDDEKIGHLLRRKTDGLQLRSRHRRTVLLLSPAIVVSVLLFRNLDPHVVKQSAGDHDFGIA